MRDQWKNTHASLEESAKLTGELRNREKELEKRRQELVSIISAMETNTSDNDNGELSVESQYLDILNYVIQGDNSLKGDGKIIVVNKANQESNDTYKNVVLSVIAGLITSALVFVLGVAFVKGAVPWYQRIIYDGVDLKGNWKEEKVLGPYKYTYSLVLEQNAHKLSGTMMLTKIGPGDDGYVQPFAVEGSTWEGYVTLNLRSTEPKSLSFATSLLTVNDLGKYMTGHMAYRARDNNEVHSEEIVWERAS